ncbi:MAG: TetR/AcrR family transcriptional regulator [bacterium]|nr:TetR/AcrR family transcriptional regulator [bacterium]
MNSEELSRYQRRKQRTRQALKEVATRLLIEKGYEAITIQDITDELDLARATFYVHFKDKDDIIWSLLQDHFMMLTAKLSAELPVPSETRHRQKLLMLFEHAQEHQKLLSVVLSERGHIVLKQRMASYMVTIIKKDIEMGLTPFVSGDSIDFTAQFLAGAMMQILTWWLVDKNETHSPQQLADMFLRLEKQTDNG